MKNNVLFETQKENLSKNKRLVKTNYRVYTKAVFFDEFIEFIEI